MKYRWTVLILALTMSLCMHAGDLDQDYVKLTRALQARNPLTDASALYAKGGFGLFMSYGGVEFPIGVDRDKRLTRADAGSDFSNLKTVDPDLVAAISKLMEDPAGGLSLEDVSTPMEGLRKTYHAVRTRYAERFNKRMVYLRYGFEQ